MTGGRTRSSTIGKNANDFNGEPKGAGEVEAIERQKELLTPPAPIEPIVYFVQMGKYIKIGHSTNLPNRLKSFATTSPERPRVLLTIPGGQAVERRLHDVLSETRVRGEFFHYEYRIDGFIRFAEANDLASAWDWLEQTTPHRRNQKREEEHQSRVAERRRTRAEENAHYAALVAERKRQLGW